MCICGNKLVFDKAWFSECSECGRQWGKTSAGNLSQRSRPTKRALDWRVCTPSQTESTPKVLSIGEQDTLPPANQ